MTKSFQVSTLKEIVNARTSDLYIPYNIINLNLNIYLCFSLIFINLLIFHRFQYSKYIRQDLLNMKKYLLIRLYLFIN